MSGAGWVMLCAQGSRVSPVRVGVQVYMYSRSASTGHQHAHRAPDSMALAIGDVLGGFADAESGRRASVLLRSANVRLSVPFRFVTVSRTSRSGWARVSREIVSVCQHVCRPL